jgi:calcium-dependent protein kinase
MADLDNEFIVKLEEVYEGETTFYIILEYLKGSSLHEMITKNGISSLNWEEIRSIMWVIIFNK